MNSAETVDMLKTREKDQEALCALARQACAQQFGDSAFLRAVKVVPQLCLNAASSMTRTN